MPKAKLTRRAVVRLAASGMILGGLSRNARSQSTTYPVGIAARATDAYSGVQRAISCLPAGEFPDVAGQTVVLKVNLVLAHISSTGTTTDPLAVQAVVDLCIAKGATKIFIVEGGQFSLSSKKPVSPPWDTCGYTTVFTPTAYPQVQMAWLDQLPNALQPVPNHYVYSQIYLPSSLLTNNVVFISMAKLKTHVWTGVTLSCKNLFGLFPASMYAIPGLISRAVVHDVSFSQAMVDMMLLRPIHFAVVEGIWGMMGNGPWNGTPVNSGVVLAGKNAVAVDRYATLMMGFLNNPLLPTFHVSHLDAASNKGLGPSANQMYQIKTYGDFWVPLNFDPPQLAWPYVSWPTLSQPTLSLARHETVTITTQITQPCSARFWIIQNNEVAPCPVKRCKTLAGLAPLTPGTYSQVWDGTDDNGVPVPAGTYLAQVTNTLDLSGENTNHLNHGATPIVVT